MVGNINFEVDNIVMHENQNLATYINGGYAYKESVFSNQK